MTEHPAAPSLRAPISLSRLTDVPAREVWPMEARDFTPWLLNNVDVLSDLLGMSLVLERAEHPVGDFSLDLIGRDEDNGSVVIVENQLEQSDHTHLGQIITYAAGTDPTTVVWVATSFRSEHRAAIDWLNERTDENTRFFGVVIRVVRIGDSELAPDFDLVAQPNDWEKTVRRVATGATGESSEQARRYRDFWAGIQDRILSAGHAWTRNRPTHGGWCGGSSEVRGVTWSMAWRREGLSMNLNFESSDAELNTRRYEQLRLRADAISVSLGFEPIWDPMEGNKTTRLYLLSPFSDIGETDRWPQMYDWLMDAQTNLRAAVAAAGGIPD